MSKLIKLLVPIVVITASIFTVQTLVAAKPTPEKKPPEERLVSLYVDEVKSEEVTLSVKTQGEVKPKTEIDIISRVSGQIVSISDQFAEGAEFDANATLVKIDDTDYEIAVISAEARVSTAKVSLERELANSKIKKDQWNRKKTSQKPSDFALNKPQIAEARANIRAAEADLRAARLNMQRSNISVPFKGRVQTKNIGIGQYVSEGTVIGKVFSTDIVEVRLPLTDSQLAELNLPLGYMAKDDNAPIVTFNAIVGNKAHKWQGRIVRTNARIDEMTRLIYAIAEVKDPYGAGADNNTPIAVGMFVGAEIASPNSQMALSLPRDALHSNDKVYVVNDESRLEIRTVDVLSTSKDTVLINSGINAGEKVVTSTLTAPFDGMKVVALDRTQNISAN